MQISSNYSSSKEFKLRNQKVTLIIEIPRGKSAYFAEQKIDFEVNIEDPDGFTIKSTFNHESSEILFSTLPGQAQVI